MGFFKIVETTEGAEPEDILTLMLVKGIQFFIIELINRKLILFYCESLSLIPEEYKDGWKETEMTLEEVASVVRDFPPIW